MEAYAPRLLFRRSSASGSVPRKHQGAIEFSHRLDFIGLFSIISPTERSACPVFNSRNHKRSNVGQFYFTKQQVRKALFPGRICPGLIEAVGCRSQTHRPGHFLRGYSRDLPAAFEPVQYCLVFGCPPGNPNGNIEESKLNKVGLPTKFSETTQSLFNQ